MIRNAQSGFGALREILDDDLPPVLGRVDSYFDELIPVVDAFDRYKRQVTAFLGNVSAATNGARNPSGQSKQVKFVRGTGPLNLSSLASPPSPYKVTRVNPYRSPKGLTELGQGLESFITAQCASGLSATINGPGDIPEDLWLRIQQLALGGEGNTETDEVPAPPCRDQEPQPSIGGPPDESTDYPHVRAEP